MADFTNHINKSLKYKKGGSVRGDDEPEREWVNWEPKDIDTPDPVSPEMMNRSHRPPAGADDMSRRMTGFRESSNVEDKRDESILSIYRGPGSPLRQAHDNVNAHIEAGHARAAANQQAAKSGMTAYQSRPDKDVDDTIQRVAQRRRLGPPRWRDSDEKDW